MNTRLPTRIGRWILEYRIGVLVVAILFVVGVMGRIAPYVGGDGDVAPWAVAIFTLGACYAAVMAFAFPRIVGLEQGDAIEVTFAFALLPFLCGFTLRVMGSGFVVLTVGALATIALTAAVLLRAGS